MHEIFLTATVPDADIERAKALLQGLSGMTAYASIHRVLYFAGPPQPRGLSVNHSILKQQQPNQKRLWSELHQNLSRQSFVLQVRYAIQPSEFSHLGSDQGSNSVLALNNRPATLRWIDIPDPTSAANGGNPLVTQRKKLDIPDTKNLPAILQDNNHTFKSELVEESFSFFTNNTEYVLVRYHRLPTTFVSSNGRPGVVATPLSTLPAWEEVLNPTNIPNVDPFGQWFLFVRRHVLEDTSPEKMAGAVKDLETIRAQLARIFVFRQVDRRAHDTRIERPYNNMPVPLPQKNDPAECRYRTKARIRAVKRPVLATGLTSLAQTSKTTAAVLPADTGHSEDTRPATARPVTSPSSPGRPEQTVYDSITATHHAPTATDSSQLFYGPSSNFAFLHQVHRGTLQNATAVESSPNQEVQEGGPGLDLFMQRTLFFGTPSRVDAEVIRPAACLQHIPRDEAEVYLTYFKSVYLARLPFFAPPEIDQLFHEYYGTNNDPTKSSLLPQTKASLLAALALGALCTPQTNTAEILLMQSKCQVVMYDDAVTLQMLQLSVLFSEYQLEMGRPNSAYLHLGVACRKAFALGLHKETATTVDSQDALQKQRATIWTLYCHETWLCLVLGRKPSLKVADISCAMPKNQPLLGNLCRLCTIIEHGADAIYGCRSASLLQLYEKAEKVHTQLRQYAEQVGIAAATTGHYRSRFDDASSLLLHNWYYHAVTLAFRPFLVADSALQASGRITHDAEMWLRHACRSAISAAQDSVAFTSSMFRKPNAVAPMVRYCAFYFDAACSVLMHDTLYHPSKYTYSLEYILSALQCLEMMPNDEPMTTTASSIRKILQAVEKSISQRQLQHPSDQPDSHLLTAESSATIIGADVHPSRPVDGAPGNPATQPERWTPLGSKEIILFSDHPLSQPGMANGIYVEARDQRQPHTENTAPSSSEYGVTLPPNHFSNLNLDVLTTDLLNFFPVDITTPESSTTAIFHD